MITYRTVNIKLESNPHPDALIMDNLETFLATTVDKARGNTSVSIVESFIKPRASTIFGRLEYYLDVPGLSILVSDRHEDFHQLFWDLDRQEMFFRGKLNTIRMHYVWRALRLSQKIV